MTLQEAETFVNAYYRTLEQHDMAGLLSFFSSAVDYHTDTMRGKAAVEDDYSRYFKRWPTASFIVENLQVRPTRSPDKVILQFHIRYSVKNSASKRSKVGRNEVTWTLERRLGAYQIITQQEK